MPLGTVVAQRPEALNGFLLLKVGHTVPNSIETKPGHRVTRCKCVKSQLHCCRSSRLTHTPPAALPPPLTNTPSTVCC
jgi:hypothetical protein